MKKVVDKIIRMFYTSYLGNLYFNFLIWWDYYKSKRKPIGYSSSAHRIVISATKAAYEQGLRQVKTKVVQAAQAVDGNYDKALHQIGDVIQLSEKDHKPEIEILKKMHVKNGQDVKNDTDKAKMIDQRIQDYKELHRFKEERLILRQIRKAKTEGNLELADKLTKEWQDKYVVTNRIRRS